MALPVLPLAAAAFGAAYLAGRVLQPDASQSSSAAAAPPDGSQSQLTDPFGYALDTATIGDLSGQPAGVLQGLDQGTGDTSGGLPGGGTTTPAPAPSPAPAPAPAPATSYPSSLGPKPAAAVAWVSCNGGAFFRYSSLSGSLPGGTFKSRTSLSGRVFSAWAGPRLGAYYNGTRIVVCKVLTGAYAGSYVGLDSGTIAYHPL